MVIQTLVVKGQVYGIQPQFCCSDKPVYVGEGSAFDKDKGWLMGAMAKCYQVET